jgi:hypothetical protein
MPCKWYRLTGVLVILVLAVVICGLASCKKKEEAPPAPPPEAAAPAADRSGDEGTDQSSPPQGKMAAAEKGQAAPARKRKIILNHALSLEVKNVAAALDSLKQIADANGGYVFKSNRVGDDGGSAVGQVAMRVPSDRAGRVMKVIRALGRVESENSTAEDITEEYVDLEARLGNAKSSEARLLGLYRQAGKLADVLAVEKELTRVRGDIEAFEAKKKNWDILTAMVTIDISLREPSAGFPTGHRFWNIIRSAFGQSVGVIADSLHALIVFVAVILPWLAIFGPLVYLLVIRRRKKKRAKEAGEGKGEARISGAEGGESEGKTVTS